MSIQDESRSSKTGKPAWLKVSTPGSPQYLTTRALIKSKGLHTVCHEARCPNAGECWSQHTATFLILGDICSRNCSFCAVKKASDKNCNQDNLAQDVLGRLSPPDSQEPLQLANAVKEMGLKYAVITSVTRDDLADGGAAHYAMCVNSIHALSPDCKIELLIPDLQGKRDQLTTILNAKVNVLNHNLETVSRLYPSVRPQADYQRSLNILRWAKEIDSEVTSKSGIMLGLGETKEEVLALMDDLRVCYVDTLTLGQYLRPSTKQLAVQAYITPEQFAEYKEIALEKGFKHVESSPLTRSSYHASRQFA